MSTLNDDELNDESTGLADQDNSHGGSFFSIQTPLISTIEDYLLAHPVNSKKMTIKTFCEKSGIGMGVMTAILNGNRWVARCSRDTVEKLAAALGTSVLQIYLLSGFLKTEDIVFSEGIDETLEAIYRKMRRDKTVNFRIPLQAEWDSWPMSAKLTVCMFYESLIEKVLLHYAGN